MSQHDIIVFATGGTSPIGSAVVAEVLGNPESRRLIAEPGALPSTTTTTSGHSMQVDRPDSLTTSSPPESSFTGDVQIAAYFPRPAPSRVVSAIVVFAPGARTPWKTNPFGQTLVVTAGAGWAQSEGQPVIAVRAGDVLWCAPEEPHWEGGTPNTAMTYVAIHEGTVSFTAPVTDDEYVRGVTDTA